MEDGGGTVLVDPRLTREADGGRRGPAVLQEPTDFYQSSCPLSPLAQRRVTRADPLCSGDERQRRG